MTLKAGQARILYKESWLALTCSKTSMLVEALCRELRTEVYPIRIKAPDHQYHPLDPNFDTPSCLLNLVCSEVAQIADRESLAVLYNKTI